jgi:hypothetical protein
VVIDGTIVGTQGATTSYTSAALSRAAHTWKIRAKNSLGVWSSYSTQFSFTISSSATTPEISSINPANNAISVPINTTVSVVFSEAMSKEATQTAFTLKTTTETTAIAGSYSWSTDSKTMTFTPTSSLGYSKVYTVTIETTAVSTAGAAIASVYRSSFTTSTESDSESPVVKIYRVDGDGTATELRNADSITTKPKIRGRITDNTGIDTSTVKVYIDGTEVTGTVTVVSLTTVEVNYEVTTALADGDHKVKIEAKDTIGNIGTKEVTGLKVASGSVTITTPVAYPMTFAPARGDTVRIGYNMTGDADIDLYIFNLGGNLVYHQRYASGTNGGRAGYNEVTFDGRSALTLAPLSMGIYTYRITCGTRLIGTGRFVASE